MKKLISLETKQKILDINWFNHLAKHDIESHEVILVNSIQEANKHITSIEWENTTLNASNNLHASLYKKNMCKELELWESLAIEGREFIATEVINKIPGIAGIARADVINDISWNLLHFIIESYLIRSFKKDHLFFYKLIDIYSKGHLVCGWKGTFPAGKILVL